MYSPERAACKRVTPERMTRERAIRECVTRERTAFFLVIIFNLNLTRGGVGKTVILFLGIRLAQINYYFLIRHYSYCLN